MLRFDVGDCLRLEKNAAEAGADCVRENDLSPSARARELGPAMAALRLGDWLAIARDKRAEGDAVGDWAVGKVTRSPRSAILVDKRSRPKSLQLVLESMINAR